MRPNVLQFIPTLDQGGSERQAAQLARLLQESGRARVSIACLDASGALREEVERLGVGEIPVFPLTSFYDRNAARQLRRFARFLREQKINVVHTHDFYSNVFGIAGARLARVPARIASKRETAGMRSRAQSVIERATFKMSNAIVVNAEAVRRQLIGDGVRDDKIVTVYNGLDFRRVTPPAEWDRADALTALGLSDSEPPRRFVTIVANLRHAVKDHPMFLRAARLVRDAVPDSAFVLAGEGELEDSLRSLAADLGIERDVFFTGRCARVAELLALSDVCVLSSTAEGFSNAILEYMAAARPVVVTDVGGAREAVTDGETGFLVGSGDHQAMAARIITLLQEPERARAMGERGRRVVEEKFSCEAQLTRTLELYERLLASRAAATAESAGLNSDARRDGNNGAQEVSR